MTLKKIIPSKAMLHNPEIYRVDYETNFCGQRTLKELINTIQYFLVLEFPERFFVESENEMKEP